MIRAIIIAARGSPSASRSSRSFGPFQYPGSGFSNDTHPGLNFPPIPLDGYPTYEMAASTVGYFLGNDTGLNSLDELKAQSKLGIVGIGWQLSMRGSRWSHLERWELETAAAIKALNPKTKVLVARSVEAGGIFWDHQRPYFENFSLARAFPHGKCASAVVRLRREKTTGAWLRYRAQPRFCAALSVLNGRNVVAVGESELWIVGQPGGHGCQVGALCNGSWGCSKCGPNTASIPFGQLLYNWTSPNFPEWWLNEHLTAGTNSSVIDGVHFDCECGDPAGITHSHYFEEVAKAGFLGHLPSFKAAKKMSIAWAAESVSPEDCGTELARLNATYVDDDTQTFQLQFDPTTHFNQSLAAFLLVRGKFALFEYALVGARGGAGLYCPQGCPYLCAAEACGCDSTSVPSPQCRIPGKSPGYGPMLRSPLLDAEFGVPLGPATAADYVSGKPNSGVWRREWSKATISLNCVTWAAEFEFK